MAKKLFGLSMFLWILIALAILFFFFGVGRREGLTVKNTCYANGSACSKNSNCCSLNCKKSICYQIFS